MGNGGSNSETGQEDVESLKRMRERVNWENEVERHEFYRQFCSLVRDWQGRLPNLREIFGREEIDWLLEECVDTGPVEFISFVARTGYRDEPELDDEGQPLLHRNTPVHYVIGSRARDWFSKTRELFKIYDKFNANYTNESGLTHFHAACMSGCDEIVEKFLELGHDPNCLVPVKKHTPLHYSIFLKRNEVSELLLRRGANPNLANYRGQTPLHIMSSSCDDVDLAKMLLEISRDKYPPMPIDALDNNGDTPLMLALRSGNMKIVESLLRSGANPNLAVAAGFTALHYICSRNVDDDTAEVFLKINEDMRQKVKVDAVNERGRTALCDAVLLGTKNKVEALLRRGANPNLAIPEGRLTPLHIIALRAEDDFMDEFFEMCDRYRLRPEVDALDQWNQAPLLLALHYGHRRSVESLLRHGANPSIANCRGSQALHVIGHRRVDDDLAETFLRMIDGTRWTLEVDARDEWGWTPLLHALRYGTMRTVELLLRRGADPNAANKNGSRALHIICRGQGDDDLSEAFFRIIDDIQRTVEIDARGKDGVTPLHDALCHGLPRTAENLLRRGADPNTPDDSGSTALHYISKRVTDDDELAKKFFETCDDIQRTVRLNALDDWGRTPLHWALDYGSRKVVKLLLERGADPTSIDTEGSTPLHVICRGDDDDDDLLDVFFEVCYDEFKMVHVDARDNEGQTPLQTAVANLLPNVVDALLDRHASLSAFSFPVTNRFYSILDESNRDKLSLASGALVVVERLEDRGYDMSRSDVLTIVQLFLKYGLFEESSDLGKYWCDEEEFMSKAMGIMIIPNSLSLFELLFLRPEEAAKLLTYTDYFEIERSSDLDDIPKQYRDLCSRHLCEKMSRGYFQRLALDAFQELTGYRLPILCSEMVIDNLMNEDLLRIYEAGEIHD
uniref:PRANC domain-containing protein n=1 Tax=Trichogramma kaykai TaxID=54128 RepID=A0ABD2X767_9HYME